MVCCSCADFVSKIEMFAEKCKNTNNMFEELLSKRIKKPSLIDNLRRKYNLDAINDDIKEEYIDCCKFLFFRFKNELIIFCLNNSSKLR